MWRLGTKSEALAERSPQQRGARPLPSPELPSGICVVGRTSLVFLFLIKEGDASPVACVVCSLPAVVGWRSSAALCALPRPGHGRGGVDRFIRDVCGAGDGSSSCTGEWVRLLGGGAEGTEPGPCSGCHNPWALWLLPCCLPVLVPSGRFWVGSAPSRLGAQSQLSSSFCSTRGSAKSCRWGGAAPGTRTCQGATRQESSSVEKDLEVLLATNLTVSHQRALGAKRANGAA